MTWSVYLTGELQEFRATLALQPSGEPVYGFFVAVEILQTQAAKGILCWSFRFSIDRTCHQRR